MGIRSIARLGMGPLLATGCRAYAPDCAEPRTVGWEPVLTTEVRLDEGSAQWESPDGAAVDAAATEGCAAAPCLSVVGPGTAQASVHLNRNTSHLLTGTLIATAPTRIRVMQETEIGDFVDLAAMEYAAGSPMPVSLAFEVNQSGNQSFVIVDVPGGTAIFDDMSLTGGTWAAVPDVRVAPIDLAFLIHVEEDVNFATEKGRWLRRAQVMTALSGVFGAHGAKLTIQPDATFVWGAEQWNPGWVLDRSLEGTGWSVHLHDEDEASVLERAIRDARIAFRTAGVDATDVNGGFLTGEWDLMGDAGLVSLTAFKDFVTQDALPLGFVQPWRPADGTGSADPDAFLVHDPDGPLLYLPGSSVKEVDHSRLPEFTSRVLSQALPHARVGFVNTWYFVLHVDNFGPEDDADLAVYFDDGSFEADVAEYDRMLTEVTDPLVEEGWIRYATPAEMADAALQWEASCHSSASDAD